MSVEPTAHTAPPIRALTLCLLILVSSLALGLSLFLAYSAHGPTLAARTILWLQIANVGLSACALAAALRIARRCRRAAREHDALITICAWTQRVLWKGRWVSFEEYLANRFNQRCTHGICDEAAAKMRADAARLELGGRA